ARRGNTTSGIDIVTNNTIAVTGFTTTALGFTNPVPGQYYAITVPGSLADGCAGGRGHPGSGPPRAFGSFQDGSSRCVGRSCLCRGDVDDGHAQRGRHGRTRSAEPAGSDFRLRRTG